MSDLLKLPGGGHIPEVRGQRLEVRCQMSEVLTKGVHQLVDQVEDGHLERDPALLLGLHADEQAVEAVGLPVHAVPREHC